MGSAPIGDSCARPQSNIVRITAACGMALRMKLAQQHKISRKRVQQLHHQHHYIIVIIMIAISCYLTRSGLVRRSALILSFACES